MVFSQQKSIDRRNEIYQTMQCHELSTKSNDRRKYPWHRQSDAVSVYPQKPSCVKTSFIELSMVENTCIIIVLWYITINTIVFLYGQFPLLKVWLNWNNLEVLTLLAKLDCIYALSKQENPLKFAIRKRWPLNTDTLFKIVQCCISLYSFGVGKWVRREN